MDEIHLVHPESNRSPLRQLQLGVAFSVAGSSALSMMAYDGTNFWIGGLQRHQPCLTLYAHWNPAEYDQLGELQRIL